MPIFNRVNEVLHKIKVRLYPNYLNTIMGLYIARTVNEATLSIEEICAALKNRGGFTGSYDDLVAHVNQFFDELAYQLCDGFAVNLKYFSIHPNVGGTFDKASEEIDPKKHPVNFRFRSLSALRLLAEQVLVEVDGIADVSGYIDEFVDVATESVNEALTPAGMFIMTGHKIRISGDRPEVGVYFVSPTDPSNRVKASRRLAENTPSKLIGAVPVLEAGVWRVEVVTQYTTSSALLKEPRVLTLPHDLTVLPPTL
jgi:hypothetical protein